MFFALQLDRGNILQALSDGMLKDLNISTNDYNYGQTIFYCTFLFAELPSQLISKKYVACQICLESLLTVTTDLGLIGGSPSRWSRGVSWPVCKSY